MVHFTYNPKFNKWDKFFDVPTCPSTNEVNSITNNIDRSMVELDRETSTDMALDEKVVDNVRMAVTDLLSAYTNTVEQLRDAVESIDALNDIIYELLSITRAGLLEINEGSTLTDFKQKMRNNLRGDYDMFIMEKNVFAVILENPSDAAMLKLFESKK